MFYNLVIEQQSTNDIVFIISLRYDKSLIDVLLERSVSEQKQVNKSAYTIGVIKAWFTLSLSLL